MVHFGTPDVRQVHPPHPTGDDLESGGVQSLARHKKDTRLSPWLQVSIISGLFFILSVDRGSIPQLLRLLQKEHSFSASHLGLLGGANYIGRAIGSPACTVVSILRPRSEIKIIAACVMLWTLGMMITGLLFSLGMGDSLLLVFARFISGAGEIVMLTLGPVIVADCAPAARKSTLLGIFLSAMPIGLAGGYAGCGMLIQDMLSSVKLFAFLAVLGVCSAASLLLIANRFTSSTLPHVAEKAVGGQGNNVLGKTRELMGRSGFVPLIIANVFWIGELNAMQYCYMTREPSSRGTDVWYAGTRGPTMLQELFEASNEESGVTFGLVTFVTGVVGVQAGGMITDLIMAGIVSQKRRDGGPGVSRSAVLVSQCLAFAVLALLALTIMPWAPGYRTYVGLLFTGFLLLQLGVTPVTEAILASAEGDGASDLRALSMAVLNITDQAFGAGPLVLLVGVLADSFEDQRWVAIRVSASALAMRCVVQAVEASCTFVVVPILCYLWLIRGYTRPHIAAS